ncbi:Predicted nuclease, contains PIN domain, potential toxin-antitoxin system component [Duganella sp. CF402]|uniref:DUF5615 family PIN-like protein n=1 Tax=unclassified Duganella TaxID=2636909 RepID=UPI0008BD7BDD|nr:MULTISPECIES: DUF5615 family PIN-like protein [unclassified Duganella]RZT05916.1 putative nuclease of predicted toxin-antitoxin system [Duganella sp. BK701]SEN17403.1 Predicted nuclease, contains PIN domain, potential toxin-antitoxin system component [Duganella sp. CF402]
MKFLIDNQLPGALARFLQQKGLDSLHVSDIGLEAATDEIIWQYARLNDLIIVSKDSDFIHRAHLGSLKPQILWVRCGNCSKNHLFKKFGDNISKLAASISSGAVITELP